VALSRSTWVGLFAEVRVDLLVFVDEFGCATTMRRSHGRAARGERVVCRVPNGHWKTLSTIAAMTARGMTAAATFEGATDTDMFVAFVHGALLPTLRAGDVVVMDNLSVHHAVEVSRLIEGVGARLLHLPPCSPDLNPSEMAI